MMEAGSETTSTLITNLALMLAANPRVFEKAQEEIDRVVGSEQMPRLDDFQRLPYLQAVVNEVLTSSISPAHHRSAHSLQRLIVSAPSFLWACPMQHSRTSK